MCNRQLQTFFLCVAAFSFSLFSATPALHTTVITSCLESNMIHQYYADISKKLMTSLKFAKIKVFSSEAVNFDICLLFTLKTSRMCFSFPMRDPVRTPSKYNWAQTMPCHLHKGKLQVVSLLSLGAYRFMLPDIIFIDSR